MATRIFSPPPSSLAVPSGSRVKKRAREFPPRMHAPPAATFWMRILFSLFLSFRAFYRRIPSPSPLFVPLKNDTGINAKTAFALCCCTLSRRRTSTRCLRFDTDDLSRYFYPFFFFVDTRTLVAKNNKLSHVRRRLWYTKQRRHRNRHNTILLAYWKTKNAQRRNIKI